ncbi:MAG TPA: prolyl oligopeptidase family serine peptidase [Planctomycetota bacterium]|nr:prolyl oligopeptidase family serine peptidase [Planctomycetota bacterium]
MTYGLWNSPLTPKSLALGQRLGDALWDTDGKTLVWLEGRGERGVLVASSLDGNAPRDLTDEQSVRARVGYGGGDFTVAQGHVVFASNGRLYRKNLQHGAAHAITPALGHGASPAVSPGGAFVMYVYSHERRDGLAIVDAEGKHWPKKIAEGHDFYMQPRWSADGTRVAWVAWDHPNMPWDSTELYLADVELTDLELPSLKNVRGIAGEKEIATFQPEFSPDGNWLSYLSDEGGWFNFYLYDLNQSTTRCLTDERGAQLGTPAWNQGQRMYGWTNDSTHIIFIRNERGVSSLHALEVASGMIVPLSNVERYTDFLQPALNPIKRALACAVSSGVQPPRIVVKELEAITPARVVKRATSESIEASELIAPKPITWRGEDGAEVHGLLYSTKRDGIPGLPPAIIRVHGGPTGQARAAYSGEIQFLATRGYTVLDLNYRGSTGYGRDYMNALRGNWGIHDVNDSVSAAKHLGESGLADSTKLVIMGGSAGGFTVLQALVTHPGLFKAGVCLYGVSNQFGLAMETHKFEERYTDSLLGPLPEAAALYRERSPEFFAHKIVDPIVVFQGEIDEVVPKNQSDAIVASLKARNIQHEYHVYNGEGHGWRKVETIEAYIASVEKFLKRHVLFA